MELTETKIDGEIMFEGRVFQVELDHAKLTNGAVVRREVVRHPGGVCIAAITANQEVLMVRQFRYPPNKPLLELPAGKLEYGEQPDLAAARELSEETGMTADSIVRLAYSYPSPGFSDECLYLYLATGLRYVGQHLDENELLNVETVPLSDAVQMVVDGVITDGKTQTLLLLADKLIKRG